jgi:HPt (histidine-containing phosphotransfer) domain-containing protein
MSGVFDEEALMDNLDGDIEFLEETVAMLDEDYPPLLDEIRQAAAARDAAALVQPAHTLKGMLANFCAAPAEAAARELEFKARENRLADVDTAVQMLQQETEQLRDALHSFVQARRS